MRAWMKCWAWEIGDGAGLAHGAKGAFLETLVAGEVGALEFFPA